MKNNKSRKNQNSYTAFDKRNEAEKEIEKKVEIYVDERFYGRIKMKFPRPPKSRDEEDVAEEIVRRIPSLKNVNFTTSF